MDRTELPPADQCWVDVFERDYFMGRMRRLVGPRNLRQLNAKSVIVGPHATVVLTVRRGGRDRQITFKPLKIIPVLATTIRGAKIRKAIVALKKKPG